MRKFLVTSVMLDEMLADRDQVDVYLAGPMGRLSDLMIDFAQKTGRPMVLIPSPQYMQTIVAAPTRAQGLKTYSYRTWKDTLDSLEALRMEKMLRNTRVLKGRQHRSGRSMQCAVICCH